MPNIRRGMMGAAGAGGDATEGKLWRTGRNVQGEVGDGTTTDRRATIVQIGSDEDWVFQNAGSYSNDQLASSFFINSSGELYATGNNTYGELGLGNTTAFSAPQQVGTLTDWSKVACGRTHTIGLKTDGTLWAWGRNNEGQLGVGDTTDISSPVQVGSLTNWDTPNASYQTSAALKTDGTLWTWGNGGGGTLGHGDENNLSSPVQVGSLTTWSSTGKNMYSISQAMMATKTDGTLWGWGGFNNGMLGNGTTSGSESSPIQIGSLTNWSAVHGGHLGMCAVKTDGTIWAWGYGYGGMNGDGTTTQRSSPVQIGSLTDWSDVRKFARNLTVGFKTDGTIWGWGKQVPMTGNEYSSPVQIGDTSEWISGQGAQGGTCGGFIGPGPVTS